LDGRELDCSCRHSREGLPRSSQPVHTNPKYKVGSRLLKAHADIDLSGGATLLQIAPSRTVKSPWRTKEMIRSPVWLLNQAKRFGLAKDSNAESPSSRPSYVGGSSVSPNPPTQHERLWISPPTHYRRKQSQLNDSVHSGDSLSPPPDACSEPSRSEKGST
jgi:hypothetical protein